MIHGNSSKLTPCFWPISFNWFSAVFLSFISLKSVDTKEMTILVKKSRSGTGCICPITCKYGFGLISISPFRCVLGLSYFIFIYGSNSLAGCDSCSTEYFFNAFQNILHVGELLSLLFCKVRPT